MNKSLKEAIEEYERNIESGLPFYMEASVLMDIEEYYEKKGMQYEAERLMRFAEKLHPEDEDVLLVKAYRLKAQGKWDEALTAICEIGNTTSLEVKIFLAEWTTAEGLPAAAERSVLRELPQDMALEDYDWYLDLGEIFLDYGFSLRALRLLEQIPENYSQRRKVDELIAEVYYQLQNYKKSAEALNRLIDADPYDAIAWAQLADIQQKGGQYEDCIVSCDYALAIDENSQQAMTLKLYSTFALDKADEGLQLYEDFAKKMPNDYIIRMYTGEELLSQKQYTEARFILQEALRLCPLNSADRTRIVKSTVLAYACLKKPEQAEELLLSLTLTGEDPCNIYEYLSDIFMDCHLCSDAARMYENIVILKSENDYECMRIAELAYTRRCFAPAESLWDRLARIPYTGSHTKAYAFIAYALREIKKAELYIACIQRAIFYCGQFLASIFKDVYGTTEPNEIREKAIAEASEWGKGY